MLVCVCMCVCVCGFDMQVAEMMVGLLESYMQVMDAFPLATRICTAAVMACLGDVVAQVF